MSCILQEVGCAGQGRATSVAETKGMVGLWGLRLEVRSRP